MVELDPGVALKAEQERYRLCSFWRSLIARYLIQTNQYVLISIQRVRPQTTAISHNRDFCT